MSRALDELVNVVMELKGPVYSLSELQDAGVRRISVGGSVISTFLEDK